MIRYDGIPSDYQALGIARIEHWGGRWDLLGLAGAHGGGS